MYDGKPRRPGSWRLVLSFDTMLSIEYIILVLCQMLYLFAILFFDKWKIKIAAKMNKKKGQGRTILDPPRWVLTKG